jgi:hypothetical protein
MRLRAAIGALLLVACTRQVDVPETDDHDLIGGDDSHDAEIPATIGISAAGHHACTAARVGTRQIITAAHCVLNLSTMAPYYDATHPVDVRVPDGKITTYPVKEAHVHPAWTEKCAKTLCSVSAVTAKLDAPDVAVLELVDAIADLAIAPVDKSPLAPGDKVTVTGFGCTTGVHVTDDNVAVALRSAQQSVVSPTLAIHSGSFVTADDQPVYDGNYALTAGSAGLCPGDSGGPLYRNGAVVGVNANYTLLPDDQDQVGIPVTNWHTRLSVESRNGVGDWLATVGVP